MTRRWPHRLACLAASLLAASLAPAAHAQSFTKVTDVSNPIVALGAGPGGSFIGSAWVDSDGDGDLDLFIVRNGLFRNDGGGTFTHLPNAIRSQGSATGTTWADTDNDGDLDCFVAGGAPNGSALYRNLGGNAFEKVTSGVMADTLTHFGWAAAFGDYDADGRVDLVLAAPVGFNGVTGPNRLFHGTVAGFERVDTSTVATGLAFYTVPSWCDFDGDGDADLAIGSGSGGGGLLPDALYRNRAESTPGWLQRWTAPPLATDLHDGQLYHWVDYDGDGDLDAYLTNFGANANTLYANLGGGTFVARTAAEVGTIVSDVGPSLASVWEDFDNDGDLDCYVTNAQSFAARFYRNDGGTFTALSLGSLTAAGPHWGATAGDYDGDGALDLYVNGNGSTHGLFRNTTASGNHWLRVKLRGTLSNRSAIGARVRLRSVVAGSPRWQLRHLSAQNSFDGMSDLAAHFGLRDGALAESLIVEWPSGLRSVLTGIAANQTIEIVEASGTTAVTASLLESVAEPGRVRLAWRFSQPALRVLGVERSADRGEWLDAAVRIEEEGERVAIEDTAVQPGHEYAYRLVYEADGGARRTESATLRVPEGWALAIRALGVNPGRGPVRVEFELPSGAPATLDLYDAGGRRVDSLHVGGAAAGAHSRVLGASHALRPGVYLVRLRQGGREVTAKVARVE